MKCKLFTQLRQSGLIFISVFLLTKQTIAQSCLTNMGTASSTATVWLKPENATQSAGVVTSWTNAGYASALPSFAATGTGAGITYQDAGLNFNPTIKFNAGQYMRVASVARSSFMPNNTAFTSVSVHYAASGIMYGHQTGASTQKFSHELGGGFIGSTPTWFTFPTTGSASLTTILVNSSTVFPYGNGRVGTTVNNSPLPDAGADLVLGAFRAGEYRMNGQAAEILMYNFALSATQRNQVESYLASKYGITLDQTSAQNYTASDGTAYWSAANNGTRRTRITVIGRDDCFGLNQKQSISSETGAMVTVGNGTSIASTNALNTNTFSADKAFLAFGDDNGSITAWIGTGAPVGRLIVGRKWQVDETGTIASVRIRVPDDGSAATSKLPVESSRVTLLVDADGDFSSGAAEKPMNLNGTNWETDYEFSDGQYFTFATLAAGYTLPVKFSKFDAQVQSNNNVSLVWNVETEQGIKGYQIERSADGINFTPIGYIDAAGQRSYSFVDAAPLASAYYRVKSMDKDNAYGLTSTVKINGRKTAVIMKAFFSSSNSLTVLHEAAIQGTRIIVNSIDGKLITDMKPQAGTQKTTVVIPPTDDTKLYMIQYIKPNGDVKTIKIGR